MPSAGVPSLAPAFRTTPAAPAFEAGPAPVATTQSQNWQHQDIKVGVRDGRPSVHKLTKYSLKGRSAPSTYEARRLYVQ